jgi:hypothetical protein
VSLLATRVRALTAAICACANRRLAHVRRVSSTNLRRRIRSSAREARLRKPCARCGGPASIRHDSHGSRANNAARSAERRIGIGVFVLFHPGSRRCREQILVENRRQYGPRKMRHHRRALQHCQRACSIVTQRKPFASPRLTATPRRTASTPGHAASTRRRGRDAGHLQLARCERAASSLAVAFLKVVISLELHCEQQRGTRIDGCQSRIAGNSSPSR